MVNVRFASSLLIWSDALSVWLVKFPHFNRSFSCSIFCHCSPNDIQKPNSERNFNFKLRKCFAGDFCIVPPFLDCKHPHTHLLSVLALSNVTFVRIFCSFKFPTNYNSVCRFCYASIGEMVKLRNLFQINCDVKIHSIGESSESATSRNQFKQLIFRYYNKILVVYNTVFSDRNCMVAVDCLVYWLVY